VAPDHGGRAHELHLAMNSFIFLRPRKISPGLTRFAAANGNIRGISPRFACMPHRSRYPRAAENHPFCGSMAVLDGKRPRPFEEIARGHRTLGAARHPEDFGHVVTYEMWAYVSI